MANHYRLASPVRARSNSRRAARPYFGRSRFPRGRGTRYSSPRSAGPAGAARSSAGAATQASLLHPEGRARLRAGQEIERRPHSQAHGRSEQVSAAVQPFVLLWQSEARPRPRRRPRPRSARRCARSRRRTGPGRGRDGARDDASGYRSCRRRFRSSSTSGVDPNRKWRRPSSCPASITRGIRSGPAMRRAPRRSRRRISHATGAPSGKFSHAPRSALHHRVAVLGGDDAVHAAQARVTAGPAADPAKHHRGCRRRDRRRSTRLRGPCSSPRLWAAVSQLG